MEQIRRIPRPFGLTAMVNEYRNTSDPELLNKVRLMTAHNWMLNGGKVLGSQMTIHELAFALGVTVVEIHNLLANQMLGSKLWAPETQEEMVKQLIGTAIGWTLEDRLLVDQQLNTLLMSQGGQYKPFISSEVTKALNLKMVSTNSLQSLLRNLSSSGTVNIFNQQNNIQNTIEPQGIVQEDAMLIVQKALAEEKVDTLTYIESTGILAEIPEVVANKQIGIDTSKEGLNISKTEITTVIDDYKGATQESDITHHQMRREIEEMIDIDADDPECEIY